MDYYKLTAPCGLPCFNCPLYKANVDKELRNMIANNLQIPVEKAVCKGCRGENGTILYLNMTKPCKAYQCIEEKNWIFAMNVMIFPVTISIHMPTWP